MYAGQLCLHGYGIVRACETVPGVICGVNSACHVLVTGAAVPMVVASRLGKPLPPIFMDIASKYAKDVVHTHPNFLTCRVTDSRALALFRSTCDSLNESNMEEEDDAAEEQESTMENQYECTVIPANIFGEDVDTNVDFQFNLITFDGGLQKQRASDGVAMFVTSYDKVRLVEGGSDISEAARLIFQSIEDNPKPFQDIRITENGDGEPEWYAIYTEAGESAGIDGWKLQWCKTYDAKQPLFAEPEILPRVVLPMQTRSNCYIHVYEWAQDEDDSNAVLGMGITEFQYGAMIRIANQGSAPLRPCRIRISREPDAMYTREVSDLPIYMLQYNMENTGELDYTEGYIKPSNWVIDLLMGNKVDLYEEMDREEWIAGEN